MNQQSFDEKTYWLAFDSLKGVGLGYKRLKLLINFFPSLKEAWNAEKIDLVSISGIPESVVDKFLEKRAQFSIEQCVEKLSKSKVRAICLYDKNYPKELKALKEPPLILYIKGNWDESYLKKSIGIVGTREPSDYAQETIKQISYELSISGFTIVSGMAMGIDSCAHNGAFENKDCKQIAVLANGVDLAVPMSSQRIYEKLLENNIIVSEYPPGTMPEKGYFPARNRIIAAFSNAIIVGEASLKSGALITAERALEMNKSIFGLAGSPHKQNEGILKWIRKGMARLVTGTADILEELNEPMIKHDESLLKELSTERIQQSIFSSNSSNGKKQLKQEPQDQKNIKQNNLEQQLTQLNDNEKQIFNLIPINQFISIDKLMQTTETPIAKLNSVIMKLLMKKLIKRDMSGAVSQNN